MAAVSVGLIDAEPFLDLKYEEDVAATVDFNVVLNENLHISEVQGTAEDGSYSRAQMNQLLDLAEVGVKKLIALQESAFLDE